MNVIALMEQAGFELIDGTSRLLASLEAGQPVMACDSEGAVYLIAIENGELVVNERQASEANLQMLKVQRSPRNAESLLSDPENWEKTDIPHSLGSPYALWAIRECDLLRLMSVKIGASYVSVHDAAIRTEVAVQHLSETASLEAPDTWMPNKSPESTFVHYCLWAIREKDIQMLLGYCLGAATKSIAEASNKAGLPLRPVPINV